MGEPMNVYVCIQYLGVAVMEAQFCIYLQTITGLLGAAIQAHLRIHDFRFPMCQSSHDSVSYIGVFATTYCLSPSVCRDRMLHHVRMTSISRMISTTINIPIHQLLLVAIISYPARYTRMMTLTFVLPYEFIQLSSCPT